MPIRVFCKSAGLCVMCFVTAHLHSRFESGGGGSPYVGGHYDVPLKWVTFRQNDLRIRSGDYA